MNKIIKITIITVFCLLFYQKSNAQFYAFSTNLVGWATGSPNAGIDCALNRSVSADFQFMGNFLNNSAFSTQHIMIQQGLRFWRLENNVGDFWGFHFTEMLYNIGDSEYIFKGWSAGLGFSYGYAWLLAKRWNMNFEIGLSAMYMEDNKKDRKPNWMYDALNRNYQRVMLIPTKAQVSITYLF